MYAFRNYSVEVSGRRITRSRYRAAVTRASIFLCAMALAAGAPVLAEETPGPSVAGHVEVLTLHETANLLRVSPEAVELMATGACLPGRRIGTQWRFSRTALLAWIGGRDTSPLCTVPSEPETGLHRPANPMPQADGGTAKQPTAAVPRTPVFSSDSAHQAGRDPGSSGARTALALPTSSGAEPLGEQPNRGTAEDVFLRDQRLLLKAGQLTLELGLFYSKSEQQDLVLLTDSSPAVRLAEVKRDTFTSLYSARYGLLNNLQVFASFPIHHKTDTIMFTGHEQRDRRIEGGDINIGLRRSLFAQGQTFPEMLLSLEGLIPTGKSSFGVGGGIALVKTIDPVALFGNFNYRRTFSRTFDDVTRLQPESTFSAILGYALALNDSLTLSTAAAGIFTPRTKFPNAVLRARDRFSLRFGLTSLLTQRLYVEPIVSFDLNGPGSNMNIGVSLPYTFAP